MERVAFEKALRDKPLDHATRGIFADWLEENGFDDEAVLERNRIEGLKGLEEFAADMSEGRYRSINVQTLLDAGEDNTTGGVYCFRDSDDPWFMQQNQERFWRYWALATGKQPPPEDDWRRTSFQCAC